MGGCPASPLNCTPPQELLFARAWGRGKGWWRAAPGLSFVLHLLLSFKILPFSKQVTHFVSCLHRHRLLNKQSLTLFLKVTLKKMGYLQFRGIPTFEYREHFLSFFSLCCYGFAQAMRQTAKNARRQQVRNMFPECRSCSHTKPISCTSV